MPEDRDRLELDLYCGEIAPDLIARGFDYAREMAQVWGLFPVFGQSRGIDRGEVLAPTVARGSERLVRIGAWRFGTRLVVLRADYAKDHATWAEPMLAGIFGTLAAQDVAADPVRTALASWPLATDGTALSGDLPKNWQLHSADAAPGAAAAIRLFTDRNDPDGNSAVTVVWRRTDPVEA
ncbi:hypothetical protein C8J30_101120 [Rhodobacter viridis]|uniref:Uncharacterized protein n=1 Tax=Rhodobacter viridis TaxID=1054202 RepID=A0A318U416_9RHOB|nr:hypothetical protein [Rhodobacter viridis]PYF12739.1 hypothetical protein C8J30_101120 [Rhodobacter viridis]